MTPERLRFLLEDCLRHQRRVARSAHQAAVARFLGVEPVTLRRWLRGAQPVPRQTDIIMEIFHRRPDITAEVVDNWIRARDEASRP